ncbi:hypothetical protein U6G28_08840 [Actinomycetaceae bacterium MB13-C1-2]|nr:hypothetical protein U6G28_08840 [Actinomycetaceae bacterium MB13-C1-2]
MAAPKRRLSVLGPDDSPPASGKESASKTVFQAAQTGSVLEELKALRLVIAKKLDDPNLSGRDMAALSKRHIEIGREIEATQKAAAEEAEHDAVSEDEAWDEEAI